MEVEVPDLRVAPVSEAVHDERRHARERPRRNDRSLAVGPQHDGQLAVEDVEHVGVVPVDVEVGTCAPRPEARPRGVQRLVVGEDLDPAVGRVADDLAARRRDYDSLFHEPRVCPP